MKRKLKEEILRLLLLIIQSIPRALNPKLDCNVRDDEKYRENNMEINFHFPQAEEILKREC